MVNALMNTMYIDELTAKSIITGEEPLSRREWLNVATYMDEPVESLHGLTTRIIVDADELKVIAQMRGVSPEDILRA